ncbi:hypothetical protein Y032_0656g1211 [Ancylostoma ceylanicum]|uniref:THAP-type domain-containing protein n=1 Tax=Ancylostoma ceylanicum TaxID=53326 RepID=A0A016WIH5_9BILA|nr:hypothetical protein Y032_0656g1211 [Ancylostoma ceylanicum]
MSRDAVDGAHSIDYTVHYSIHYTIHSGITRVACQDLLPRLRRRYVLLSEMGYEDVDVDMLEPNGILISPRDDPICCRVPGCRYKSCDISLFSGRYVKMFSIPTNSVEYGKWRKVIQNGIGLPGVFEFHLPDDGHICEMHFSEGKRYTRGLMQDPSVFRRISSEGISPTLSRLGPLLLTTCGVRKCSNVAADSICVRFPKPGDDLHSRWIDALSNADELFKCTDETAICLRHFSLTHQHGLVPVTCLKNDSNSNSSSNRVPLKRRGFTADQNQPCACPAMRVDPGDALLSSAALDGQLMGVNVHSRA